MISALLLVPLHGVGSRQDLPLPLPYVIAGALAALMVSFLLLGLLWKTPRLLDHGAGTPLPDVVRKALDGPLVRWTARGVGLLLAALFLVALVGGRDDGENPAPGMLYVLLWVGLVPASLVLGPVWRVVSPLRTVHALLARVLRVDVRGGLVRLPATVGYWPAAASLLAFVWLELAAPGRTSLPVLQAWVGLYVTVHLAAALVFGSRWFDRGEGFEVLSDLVGRLAPVGRREDGVLVARLPLDGIASLRPGPGLVVVVCLLLGSTMFDSVTSATAYVRWVQSAGAPRVLLDTLVLLAVVGLVAIAFRLATGAAARGGGLSRGELPGEMVHSLVPVVVGYLVAHYYSLLVLEGQRTVVLMSDPLGTGADWFSTAELQPSAALVDTTGVALLQVVAVVVGHIVGSLLAHDRAVALLPRGAVVRGQLPLLLLMLAYTVAGLLLLFAD